MLSPIDGPASQWLFRLSAWGNVANCPNPCDRGKPVDHVEIHHLQANPRPLIF